MPFRSENPIIKVEPRSMHTIDTTNVENLFGLWSIFNKCADTMEDGKRLENMSWRLWNRETFCCAPDHQTVLSSRWSLSRRATDSSSPVPNLSSSVESASSSDEPVSQNVASTAASSSAAPATTSSSTAATTASSSRKLPTRPEPRRNDSNESRSRGKGKHITPIDLEKIVISIKEKKELEPLSPLPLLSLPEEVKEEEQSATLPPPPAPTSRVEDATPRPASPPAQITATDSSTSTVATTIGSEVSNMSPPVGSDASASTELSSHSVVRGFSLGRISSSFRSSTQMASPQPVKSVPVIQKTEPAKKKGPMFTLGSESDEGNESSFDCHMLQRSPQIQSSLTEALRKPQMLNERKRAQFTLRPNPRSDEDNSGSAIEDTDESAVEDDEDEWCSEDEDDESAIGSEEVTFPRIDSRPNLTSQRSLITTALNERDRAAALQKQASRSTTALRRSRTSSPNGPSLATSPKEGQGLELRGIQIPSRPLIMTTSNTHPPATSPRTTRRNMLSTELTESLRKHLLWERQQKNATSNALLKRRHTSNDVKNLKHYPGEPSGPLATIKETSRNNNSWNANAYFDHGLQEYHVKGW